MKNKINVAIIGLGQIGNFLYNEISLKKKDIELKTGKIINIVAVSAKNKNKFDLEEITLKDDLLTSLI